VCCGASPYRPSAQRLVWQFDQLLPRIGQMINQTVRRVYHGEVVLAQDKLVSLFEPHAEIIVRRKTVTGSNLAEKCGWRKSKGLISGYRILMG
jgi:hypothetical protein